MKLGRRVASTAVPLALLLGASHASAQQRPGIDAQTWRPSTDPNASIVNEPAITPGAGVLTLGAWGQYNFHPIALKRPGTDDVAVRPISDQLMLTPIANIGVGERFAFGASLPIVLYQTGTRPLPASVSDSQSVSKTGIGDLSFNGKLTAIKNDQGGLGVAALGNITLPTSPRDAFIGEVAPTLSGRVLAEYTLLVASVEASLGYKFRTEPKTWPDANAGGVRWGSEIPWTFAIAMRPGVLGIDPKNRQRLEVGLHGWVPAAPIAPFGIGDKGASALSPVQLALSDRIELGHYRDTFLLLGGELGLTQAVGVPVFRGIVAIGWTPRPHDQDEDGVKDDFDGCPDIPEDLDGFEDSDGCPDIDNDQDGIIDREDACRDVKGVASADPKKNGCPSTEPPPPPPDADGDGDGVVDAKDKCPQEPEDKDGFEDEDGCPDPDNDGDGIKDKDDACPNVKGEASTDPALNGCPNPDRDGDTFGNDEDKCPDTAEVFNGVDDSDGCPDEGGKPLVVIDEKTRKVTLATPIKLGGTKELPEVDAASIPSLRALAQALNAHKDWTLAVGSKPASNDAQLDALAKSFAVVKVLSGLTHRDGAAETVGWDAVKTQPGAEVAFLVIVTPATPASPAPAPPPTPAAKP
ncbi:MAG: transporter [Labilithrix sp.]